MKEEKVSHAEMRAKIVELEAQRAEFVQVAQREIAAINGAIQVLKVLLGEEDTEEAPDVQ